MKNPMTINQIEKSISSFLEYQKITLLAKSLPEGIISQHKNRTIEIDSKQVENALIDPRLKPYLLYSIILYEVGSIESEHDNSPCISLIQEERKKINLGCQLYDKFVNNQMDMNFLIAINEFGNQKEAKAKKLTC